MNFLKRKRELQRLQSLPSLAKIEVCDNLHPFVVQLGLTFTENEICFPQPICYIQHRINASAYCEELYAKSIRFTDIINIKKKHDGTYFTLRAGHIFYFSDKYQYWCIRNPLSYNKPAIITVWWWMFTGWLAGWWRKLFHNNDSPQRT